MLQSQGIHGEFTTLRSTTQGEAVEQPPVVAGGVFCTTMDDRERHGNPHWEGAPATSTRGCGTCLVWPRARSRWRVEHDPHHSPDSSSLGWAWYWLSPDSTENSTIAALPSEPISSAPPQC